MQPVSPPTPGEPPTRASESGRPAIERLKLSAYEQEALEIVLKARHLELEPAPEGKLLEGVDIAPLDVFEPRDPAPAFLNWFHYTTRPMIIERELLMQREQPWVQWRAAETARRLRALRQLSLVLVVPVKGADGDHVRALIVTKDVWSLRLNTGITYRNGRLEYLLLQPSEENVAGTHLRIAGLYVYDVLSNSFGAITSHPRILGTHLSFLASSSVVVERSTGKCTHRILVGPTARPCSGAIRLSGGLRPTQAVP